jgi:hypothetical protein
MDTQSHIINWILRHSTTILLFIIGILVLFPTKEEYDTIAILLRAEAIAILLSGIALYSYTKINFTRNLLDYDKNDKYNSIEISAFSRVISAIFFAVHLLVAIIYLAIYTKQW